MIYSFTVYILNDCAEKTATKYFILRTKFNY